MPYGPFDVNRPDVLYSTSSPVSAHLVALLVSRATGIPWVADFRDAWTKNPMAHGLATPHPVRRTGSRVRLSGAPATWSWPMSAWS